MMSLTTAQRDLLCSLLAADEPLSVANLGQQLRLTPRQVSYGLREVKPWLLRRHADLIHVMGSGVQVLCSPQQRQHMLDELESQAKFQLILTPDQRQQLLALQLLGAREPFILNQFQQDLEVARATVLKDVDSIEPWLHSFQLTIARRQHRGFWIEGPEVAKRHAMAALIWGDVPFGQPIICVLHGQGIVFTLAQDAALLPIVGQVHDLLQSMDFAQAQICITEAESALGGRFTDEAVAQLSLVLAIQTQRIQLGHTATCDDETKRWAHKQIAWPVAAAIAARCWPTVAAASAEIAMLAVQLSAGARDEPWPHGTGDDALVHRLIDGFMAHIAQIYAVPDLAHDQLLRDGLEAHLLPAFVRHRFSVWVPPRTVTDTHTERYAVERAIAAAFAVEIKRATGMTLPPDAHDDLIMLLRAAIVRTRPEHDRRVLVVCPSGMATTQLLVARLKARFPRLGSFEVLPMRELTARRIANADLIISTVPITLPDNLDVDIIQVHPMLKAENIAALTQWVVRNDLLLS